MLVLEIKSIIQSYMFIPPYICCPPTQSMIIGLPPLHGCLGLSPWYAETVLLVRLHSHMLVEAVYPLGIRFPLVGIPSDDSGTLVSLLAKIEALWNVER